MEARPGKRPSVRSATGGSQNEDIGPIRRRRGDQKVASRSSRISVSVAVAFILTFAGAAIALAWNSGCPTGNLVCVHRDADFAGPFGHWFGSNASYVGENYPGTAQTVNDSVSSLRNRYPTRDVIFWEHPNYTGLGLCVDSNSSVGNLWWAFLNDKVSSHQVWGNDNYC